MIENTSNHKHFEGKVDIVPHISTLINDHRDEIEEWKIQLTMRINFVNPRIVPLLLFSYANSDN